MKRSLLTLMFTGITICGCAGRVNTDLLQARIREQAVQLTEKQREVSTAQADLKKSRQETERLKSELVHNSSSGDTAAVQISKLHIFPLASGGLNKHESPGDDAVVVQFAPLDQDHEPIKLPGELEFVLVDPKLPRGEQEVGHYRFGEEECRTHWTRGVSSSGFQFCLPLESPPQHPNLVVKLRYKSSDEQEYEASQVLKVAVAGDTGFARVPGRKKLAQVMKEADDLPPVGVTDSELPEWAQDAPKSAVTTPGHTVLHSANWTRDNIPTRY